MVSHHGIFAFRATLNI